MQEGGSEGDDGRERGVRKRLKVSGKGPRRWVEEEKAYLGQRQRGRVSRSPKGSLLERTYLCRLPSARADLRKGTWCTLGANECEKVDLGLAVRIGSPVDLPGKCSEQQR